MRGLLIAAQWPNGGTLARCCPNGPMAAAHCQIDCEYRILGVGVVAHQGLV